MVILRHAFNGLFAEVEGDDSITLDREELALAEWFERENIPVSESDISLTSEMIEYFRNHQGNFYHPS